MKRHELEHLIRAAADITGQQELVVIGSQAVLGQYPEAPDALLISIEADIHPVHAPELGTAIELHIGEGSRFDQTHGYHADGIEGGLPPLPHGWDRRLIPIHNENTNGATGWCLEVHDIAAAKYAAHREKDLRYTRDLWEEGMLDPETLEERIRTIRIDPPEKRKFVEASVRHHQRLHDTGRRPHTARAQAQGTPSAGLADTDEGDAQRAERAARIHGVRSRHADPKVRADAAMHLAAVTPRDKALRNLETMLRDDAGVRADADLAARIDARRIEVAAGTLTGSAAADAVTAAHSEQGRSEAREAVRPPKTRADAQAHGLSGATRRSREGAKRDSGPGEL